MIHRRAFLKYTVLSALPGLSSTVKSWASILSKGRKLSKIGLQLYTVRGTLQKDFEGTLAAVAEFGYREVEFAGWFGRDPRDIRALLDRLGLDSPSSHINTELLRSNWVRTIEQAKELGNRYLICAYLSPDERRSLDDYRKFAELFNTAGEACRKVGIQFGYHNHDFEFQPLLGRIPYDVLLEETDANLVKMEMDLYWITKANRDPLDYFAKYRGRFPLLHVKDMDNTPKRFFTEVGRGIIDFKNIFAHARQAGAKHYFVEQDHTPGPALESTRISFNYLKQLEF
jgi:sugar phosphate isomerase/epimerase